MISLGGLIAIIIICSVIIGYLWAIRHNLKHKNTPLYDKKELGICIIGAFYFGILLIAFVSAEVMK
jgi:uncharacterized integral membrane protein